jgi:hypothetical protein
MVNHSKQRLLFKDVGGKRVEAALPVLLEKGDFSMSNQNNPSSRAKIVWIVKILSL